jgi:hypothetical protein
MEMKISVEQGEEGAEMAGAAEAAGFAPGGLDPIVECSGGRGEEARTDKSQRLLGSAHAS